MKTKLTVLLALALTSVLHAQKPGYNGPRPSANVPVAPSRPASPPPANGGSSSSRRVNAGQIIGIAQTVLPHLIRAIQPAPKPQAMPQTSTSSKKPLASSRPVPAKKSVTVNRLPAKPSAPLAGKNNAALREGREIAEGLRSLEEIRKAIPDGLNDSLGLNGGGPRHGAGFERPFDADGNPTNGSSTPQADFSPPSHSAANRGSGLTDIRGGYSRSRQGSPATPDDFSRTGNRVFGGASYMTFGPGSGGSGGTPTYTRDDSNGDTVIVQSGTDASGRSAMVVVVEYHNSSGQAVGTKEMIFHTDEHDKEVVDVTTRDAEGRVITSGTTTQSCDRSTGDVAVGGPVNGTGPSVAEVSGLMPLDLVRQHANGEAPQGGVNRMTSGSLSSRQVNPGSTEVGALPSTRTRSSAPITTDTLSGPTSGGSTGGGDRPD